MSTLIVIASAILITFGIYFIVNGLGTLYDQITQFGNNKFMFICIGEIIVSIILIGIAIYNVVRLL